MFTRIRLIDGTEWNVGVYGCKKIDQDRQDDGSYDYWVKLDDETEFYIPKTSVLYAVMGAK